MTPEKWQPTELDWDDRVPEIEPEPDLEARVRELSGALNDLLLVVDGLPEGLDAIAVVVECECENPGSSECERCELIGYIKRLRMAFNASAEILEEDEED